MNYRGTHFDISCALWITLRLCFYSVVLVDQSHCIFRKWVEILVRIASDRDLVQRSDVVRAIETTENDRVLRKGNADEVVAGIVECYFNGFTGIPFWRSFFRQSLRGVNGVGIPFKSAIFFVVICVHRWIPVQTYPAWKIRQLYGSKIPSKICCSSQYRRTPIEIK